MKQTPSLGDYRTRSGETTGSYNTSMRLPPRRRHRHNRSWLAGIGQHRTPTVELGKGLLEIPDLGHVEHGDVRGGRVVNQVILMVILRGVKPLERIHARNDRSRKRMRLI